MSIVVCECGQYIDSDFDCDCFVGDRILCEACRELEEEDDEL